MATSNNLEQVSHEPALPSEPLEHLIFIMRGRRVMLSTHLAQLYDVEPRALVQAVKRNPERFPADFLFQLSEEEFDSLKSQSVISNSGRGGLRRALPYAFTEQGVAMLSSVLRSERAVQVNIEIMRAFVRLRRLLSENTDLAQRLNEFETTVNARFENSDEKFKIVFDAIRQLLSPPHSEQRRMGFRKDQKD